MKQSSPSASWGAGRTRTPRRSNDSNASRRTYRCRSSVLTVGSLPLVDDSPMLPPVMMLIDPSMIAPSRAPSRHQFGAPRPVGTPCESVRFSNEPTQEGPGMSELQQQNFRVNLGGVIALLSKNLYSSPGVYVRELIQNAVDAIAA